jgi:hypothetical protein
MKRLSFLKKKSRERGQHYPPKFAMLFILLTVGTYI